MVKIKHATKSEIIEHEVNKLKNPNILFEKAIKSFEKIVEVTTPVKKRR